VRALLGSATPAALRVAAAPEAGDPELAAAQQARLFALGTRTMALPLGRGALTLGAPPPGCAARPGPGSAVAAACWSCGCRRPCRFCKPWSRASEPV
jgi:hypothetical protein